MPLSPDQSEILDWVKAHLAVLAPEPTFIYFSQIAGRRVTQLRTALGPAFELFYSVKANPNADLLRYFSSLNLKLDISSGGELERAIRCGFSPAQMSFVGPGKTEAELRAALHHQVGTIVVESLSELSQLNSLASAMATQAAVSLRLHPEEFMSSAGRVTRNSPSPFGISEDQLPDVLQSLKQFSRCRVEGIHVHVGSMYFKPELIVDNFRRAMKLAAHVREVSGPLKHVNFGGGLGIPYRDSETEIDLSILNQEVTRFLGEAHGLGELSYRLESGRYLAGSAGCYLTRVLHRKKSFGRTYLVVDGGMNHALAAIGFGQALRAPFPMAAIPRKVSRELETVNIVGSSCYSIDLLAEDLQLPRMDTGDSLVVFQAGAYGPSFSPKDFLSRPEAREIVI